LCAIAEQAGFLVSYERDVIRLSPDHILPGASQAARERLLKLNKRLRTVLSSRDEPRQEGLKKLATDFEEEFSALAAAVAANPEDVAAVHAERSRIGYVIRSQIAGGRPGSFTDGDEGWTMFDTKGSVTQAVAHNPAGFLDGKDLIPGSDYYFSAPQPFLDLVRSASTDDSITFEFYTTATDIGIKDSLVLESPEMSLVLPVANPPVREWKQYTYRFHPSEGWKISRIGMSGGEPAKEEEIRRVLASATKLYIRGEWKTGPDAARLDNVFMISQRGVDDANKEPALTPGTPALQSDVNAPSNTMPHQRGEGDGVIQNVGKETEARLAQLEEEFLAAGAAPLIAEYQEVLADLRTKYAAAVKRAHDEAAGGGDSVIASVFNEERARVEAGADVPEEEDADAPAALVRLRSVFREESASAARSQAVWMKPLLDRYDAELAALESTVSDKPGDLAAVKAARERIARQR